MIYSSPTKSSHQQLNESLQLFTEEQSIANLDDPSQTDGYKTIYEKELPIHVKFTQETDTESDQKDSTQVQSLTAKILLLNDIDNPDSVRIELQSESDLFFHWACLITPENFQELQEAFKLNIGYDALGGLLIKTFSDSSTDPNMFLSIQEIFPDKKAKLSFFQDLEYKMINLYAIWLEMSPEHIIKDYITYKYMNTKHRQESLQKRIVECARLAKINNPFLLSEFNKSINHNTGFFKKGENSFIGLEADRGDDDNSILRKNIAKSLNNPTNHSLVETPRSSVRKTPRNRKY